jgi:hypothetical protein
VQRGEILEILGERVVHQETESRPGDRRRRQHRNDHELESLVAHDGHSGGLAGLLRLVDQPGKRERISGAPRGSRVHDEGTLERDERHDVGPDARAVVRERGADGFKIAGRNGLAKSEIQ